MKQGLVLSMLLLLGCSSPSTQPSMPHDVIQRVSRSDQHLITLLDSGLNDSLSSMLGWRDFDHSYLISHDARQQTLLIPLEADDEIRFMVCMFRDHELVALTAIGWSETDWFSPARAETLAQFEGWLHYYDVSTGMRCLSRYYEGSVSSRMHSQFNPRALPYDLLSNSERFAWLSLQMNETPSDPRTTVFLTSDADSVISYIAPHIKSLFMLLDF